MPTLPSAPAHSIVASRFVGCNRLIGFSCWSIVAFGNELLVSSFMLAAAFDALLASLSRHRLELRSSGHSRRWRSATIAAFFSCPAFRRRRLSAWSCPRAAAAAVAARVTPTARPPACARHSLSPARDLRTRPPLPPQKIRHLFPHMAAAPQPLAMASRADAVLERGGERRAKFFFHRPSTLHPPCGDRRRHIFVDARRCPFACARAPWGRGDFARRIGSVATAAAAAARARK